MKAVFLDLDTMGPEDLDTNGLRALLPDIEFFSTTTEQELSNRVENAEVVVINKTGLDKSTLENAQQLKLICLVATGTDNVCLDTAARRNIAVCNIRNYCTPSVVQHVFALILGLTQHTREYQELLTDGAWKNSPQFCLLDFPIRELGGKTLGIVGLGALGKGVAAAGQAFGMDVIAARRPYRAYEHPTTKTSGNGIPRVNFQALLAQSDIVSLHCPLDSETNKLIDADALTIMKNDALLINTARGGLIDPDALLNSLETGGIGGAGIDVLTQEPPVDGSPLIGTSLPNLIVTPHIAWAARESRQRALDEVVENIQVFLEGGKRNRVL